MLHTSYMQISSINLISVSLSSYPEFQWEWAEQHTDLCWRWISSLSSLLFKSQIWGKKSVLDFNRAEYLHSCLLSLSVCFSVWGIQVIRISWKLQIIIIAVIIINSLDCLQLRRWRTDEGANWFLCNNVFFPITFTCSLIKSILGEMKDVWNSMFWTIIKK